MTEQLPPSDEKKMQVQIHNSSADAVYGLGMIGAWMYYFSRSTTTDERVRAFFKGLVWPAILVRKMFEFFEKE